MLESYSLQELFEDLVDMWSQKELNNLEWCEIILVDWYARHRSVQVCVKYWNPDTGIVHGLADKIFDSSIYLLVLDVF